VCDALGVPLQVIRVQVRPGASLERAAREARYQAFAEVTGAGELLITGQHRDDQAETLLFRLLRGAGVRGLAAMPVQRPLAGGYLVRPLLDVSRADLEAYAREHQLTWVEDPSNADPRFSRNYLRHHVFPRLIERWPQAVSTMARSAEHLSEAQGLLDELAQMDLLTASQPPAFPWLVLPSLTLEPLAALSEARQRNALMHWLTPLTRLPDSEHWAGWATLRDAKEDAQPLWRLADGQLHRCGGHIWWLPASWSDFSDASVSWSQPQNPLQLPGNGQLHFSGDTRVGARGVDEGQDRHLEALGHFHQAASLAVAFGTRHAEVATDFLTHFTAFLVTDHHHWLVVQASDTAHNGGVVGEVTVAVQFIELGEDVLDVVQGVRTARVAGQTRDLPAGQLAEDVFGKRAALVLQASDFIADIQRIVIADQAQLFDLGLQVSDRLFEIKKIRVHKRPSWVDGQGVPGQPVVYSRPTLRERRG